MDKGNRWSRAILPLTFVVLVAVCGLLMWQQRTNNQRATPHLLPLLSSAHASVRCAVLEVLGSLRDPLAAKDLCRARCDIRNQGSSSAWQMRASDIRAWMRTWKCGSRRASLNRGICGLPPARCRARSASRSALWRNRTE